MGSPREVIAAHIEPHVVRCMATGLGMAGWARAHGERLSVRCELKRRHRDFAVNDAKPLLSQLAQHGARCAISASPVSKMSFSN